MQNKMYRSRNDVIKAALLRVSDRISALCRVANEIAPPNHLSFQYGSGSYFEVGLHFFRLLLDLCHLDHSAHILDVGCARRIQNKSSRRRIYDQ
jgi:hypothetical protein